LGLDRRVRTAVEEAGLMDGYEKAGDSGDDSSGCGQEAREGLPPSFGVGFGGLTHPILPAY
jgi:hypothetical protein